MKQNRLINILSIMFIALWITQIPYLFPHPFQQHKWAIDLAETAFKYSDSIKEMIGINKLNQKDLEDMISSEIQLEWIKSLIIILIGSIAGLLLLKHNKIGRVLALLLSAYIVLSRIYIIFDSGSWRDKLTIKYLAMRYQYYPLRAFHEDITFILLVMTILLLLYPSIGNEFKKKLEHNQTLQ